VDFNGRVTGGIEAHVEPIPPSVDTVIDQFEKSMELGHLQLGQAIKRKYTELEEISQRLRSRLVDVTGETLKFPEFDVDSALDSWQQANHLCKGKVRLKHRSISIIIIVFFRNTPFQYFLKVNLTIDQLTLLF